MTKRYEVKAQRFAGRPDSENRYKIVAYPTVGVDFSEETASVFTTRAQAEAAIALLSTGFDIPGLGWSSYFND